MHLPFKHINQLYETKITPIDIKNIVDILLDTMLRLNWSLTLSLSLDQCPAYIFDSLENI